MKELTRRDLLKGSVLAGAGVWVGAESAVAATKSPTIKSPNEKLNVGYIGVAGRGAASLNEISKTENVAALCDVDELKLNEAGNRFSGAQRYADFRKMLEQKNLDAVVVSTPDHLHCHAALWALDAGLHVYCEKPLTHSVEEARRLAKAASRKRLATQMGNQGHSNDGTRRVVELVQAGVVGPIREVHCWTDRPIWPQGIDRPAERPAPPSTLNWDLWLGPAQERPYNPAYVPFKWRGWWDFGTGALGDMACHVCDTAFWALQLRYPTSVEAVGEPRHPESAPKWSIIRYEFPERGELPPVTLMWYDGAKKPPARLAPGATLPENGTLLVGEKGTVLLPDPYGSTFVLLPKEQFNGFTPPKQTIANSPGHHAQWVAACKNRGQHTSPASDFQYAAALTEMVLLGNVALRVGHRIDWDPKKMRATNCSEAEQYLKRDYRKGWEL